MMPTTPSRLAPVSDDTPSSLSNPQLPVLRGVPRRAWLPRMVDDSPSCGWYESSQTLRQGLAVTELELDDAMLPLLWASAWPAPVSAVPASR